MPMNLFFICIKIFFARILDVSIGTFRTMVMLKGNKITATILAFFEVLIWFLIAREALIIDINSLFIPIAYAGGFACGTFIGQGLSNRFIKGVVGIQVIAHKYGKRILAALKEAGYVVSVIHLSEDYHNKKMLLFLQVNKKSLNDVEKIVLENDPDAFLVVSETKKIQNGVIK